MTDFIICHDNRWFQLIGSQGLPVEAPETRKNENSKQKKSMTKRGTKKFLFSSQWMPTRWKIGKKCNLFRM